MTEAAAPPPKARLSPHKEGSSTSVELRAILSDGTSAARDSSDAGAQYESRSEAVPEDSDSEKANKKRALLHLLHLQLDLYDRKRTNWSTIRNTQTFFKIYVREFEGAAELRDKLMHTKTTDEVREVLM